MGSVTRRNRKERVKLSDVAKKAGVSAITVSRALSKPYKVSDELRNAILRIVDEMGYVPDLAARALASRHSGVVGVVCGMLGQQVFTPTMQGIEDRLRSTGLRIQYASASCRPDEAVVQTQAFLAQNSAGLILAGIEFHERLQPIIDAASCPVVHILDMAQWPAALSVGISHREAGREATRYMLSRGYRRIAMLGGSMDASARQRLAGYTDALRGHDLFHPDLVLHDERAMTDVSLGARLFGQLLDGGHRFDGVFCQSDDVALGVLFECRRRGIRIAEDMGICGFNDLEFAAMTEPGLTSVRIPGYRMGHRAADMLMDAIDERGSLQGKVDLGFTIVARGTTR